ncbi:DUF4279 domain-containing protein [Planococcus lenghuensis]|uniref:DUF4279 domain-containing protein n=1 Tax=Planococcus lenghuensis TaxID=2213202 RepID=A0A1Q2L4I1_9BACL|nr:DUF4279 domain-containing protein [Planococcus lenghuensis]AQQ55284.1 hypothetical protein B0X71_19080 [Planococcus lenghuensis]
MEKTNSYTYFGITSNGEMGDRGFEANKKGIFNPKEITDLLDIQPFSSWAYGENRTSGTKYGFSSWNAEKSDIDRLDVEAQCRDTIKRLKSKIPLLNQIKEQYDVNFVLMIVPSIYGDEQPWIAFNEEVIEFCYLTETTIEVDMYM